MLAHAYLLPANKVCKGYVYTGICVSTGGSWSLSGSNCLHLGGLCSGGLCQGGLCPGGLCPGGLCLEVSVWEVPIQGVSVQGVSVWGTSVWGSLSRGVCQGVSVQGGLCQGVYLQGGLCPGGSLPGRPPIQKRAGGTHPIGMHSCTKDCFLGPY